MASQIAASPDSVAAAPTVGDHFVRFCVRRRVAISLAVFAGLIGLDLFVIHSRPRNFFDVFDPLAVVALLFVVVGLMIRSWAAGTLRKQKELATTGPYAWVRHPLYFGSFLMMVGFGVLINDWL